MPERMWRKGTFLYCRCESNLMQSLWRTVWRVLRKLETELPYDPAIPLLSIYLDKIIIEKDTCTSIFIAALFTIAKAWKQPRCSSTEEWIKKMLHIYNGILLSYKKELMPFAAKWMQPEIIILSEVSQKDKYHMISLICRI